MSSLPSNGVSYSSTGKRRIKRVNTFQDSSSCSTAPTNWTKIFLSDAFRILKDSPGNNISRKSPREKGVAVATLLLSSKGI